MFYFVVLNSSTFLYTYTKLFINFFCFFNSCIFIILTKTSKERLSSDVTEHFMLLQFVKIKVNVAKEFKKSKS